jgi:hypothetical protein
VRRHTDAKEHTMQLDKGMILDFLREQGQNQQAQEAEQQLPDQVDTEQHASLLSNLGIDVPTLISKFAGGGAAGGLGGLLG